MSFCLSDLPMAHDLAVDVGCLHSLSDDDAHAYAAGLARLLRPGATYVLFGRLADPTIPNRLGRLTEPRVRALFAPSLQVDRVVYGVTTTAQGDAVPSAWFWLARR